MTDQTTDAAPNAITDAITNESFAAALDRAGYRLPTPPDPVAAYLPCVQSGSLVFVSGQLPLTAGQLLAEGLVDSQVDEVQAAEAARQCTLNGLAILHRHLDGDWSRLVRVVRVGCFVAADPDFTGHSIIANGASELLVDLFGDRGRHARAAVGTASLPLGASVEVEFVFEIA